SDEEGDRLVISTLTDVTVQRRVLDQLQRSQERFAKAFNFSPLNMTITRLSDGAFIEVNRAEDRVQGYQPEELAGKTSVGAGAWLTAEDRAAFIRLLEQEGRVHAYDTVMRHKDGRLRESRLWAERIEVDGEDCILACTVDVSEEKRREKQLIELARGMTGSSAEDFFVSLTVHMAHALEADMTCVAELTSDGQLRTLAAWRDGQTISNYVYPLKGTPCGEATAQPGLCVFAQDLDRRFAHREGIVRGGFKSYIGQRLQDENGQPVGMIYAMWRQPLTLQRDAQSLVSIFASRANAELLRLQRDREIQALNATLEQRVQARTADLIKLNAELDSFAYSVSHDLKSPLRSIDGFTRLLSDQMQGRMQPDEADMMQRILGATSRMSALITDLLALARVSQGQLERQTVDLSAMVDDILDTEMQRHPDRRLERRITPGLRASCDPRLTRIALENLVGNALKYTRACDPAVIEFGRAGADELYLRDNGIGFDMAYADKLFKPFQRLHMPDQFEGTGIGLATVRRIVERHGGAVAGRGVPGGGAEFRFGFGPATLSAEEAPSSTGATA
ncbi:MAG: PAS domain S-box protein, partial [Burkholderiales bacterium]